MIEKLVNKINEANLAYRTGDPIMSDSEYDILIDELKDLDPDNDLLLKVGFEIEDDSRKRALPIGMASMNKVKKLEEVYDWVRLKEVDRSEYVIITPKFDGLSLCVDEINIEATTRGNGIVGQNSDHHYKLIGNHLYENIHRQGDPFGPIDFKYTYGEVMMPKRTFLEKYSTEFSNPRNLVGGLINSPDARPALRDCNYIKYGGVPSPGFEPKTKQEIIDLLNEYQEIKVEYTLCRISELSEDLLIDLFHKYSIDYEIDGLIIEINDLAIQKDLGRDRSSNNPSYAVAFKHSSFEQSAETEVLGISWNISKQGFLKPIVHVNTVRLDGVNVSNVTANNARFVKDMGIGVGAKIRIVRSGMVIPKIVDIIEPVEFDMPNIPNITWNDNGVELVTMDETEEQKIKQAISFLEIIGVERVGEGVVRQLWDAGFNSIKSILEATPEQLNGIDGFGKRKSTIVTNSIKDKIKDVSLSKLQHASGLFGNGLGSRKLALLEHFSEKPTIEEVMRIDGFAETSAKNYIDNYDRFFEFAKDLPVVVSSKKEEVLVGSDLVGKSFVFTGVRLPEAEKIIRSKGGVIGSTVSKNTTHLVCKDPNSGSSKLEKAKSLGIIVLSLNDLDTFLS